MVNIAKDLGIDMGGAVAPKVEEPKVEKTKVEEEPKTEESKVEESKVEESKTEEPKVEEESKTEEPEEPEVEKPEIPKVPEGPVSVEDEIAENRKFFIKELERLTSVKITPKPETPETPETPEKPEKPKESVEPELQNFIKDDDEFDKMLTSREEFNKAFSRVFEAGRQSTLRSIPKLIEPLVDEKVDVMVQVRNFYQDNPDLYEFRTYIGAIANELQAQHPEYSLDKLFNETESEARKRLRLIKKKAAVPDVKKPAPAFASPPNSRKTETDTRNKVTKDIDAMIKARNKI